MFFELLLLELDSSSKNGFVRSKISFVKSKKEKAALRAHFEFQRWPSSVVNGTEMGWRSWWMKVGGWGWILSLSAWQLFEKWLCEVKKSCGFARFLPIVNWRSRAVCLPGLEMVFGFLELDCSFKNGCARSKSGFAGSFY